MLIADEVINGFGRTGKWFGMDHFDVEPDIMTTAKQISSGYSPIAATLVSDKIARTFEEAGKDGTIGGITWGANPVSCAVALGNLNIIESEGLVENAAHVGEHVRSRLVQLREEHRTIHHTRGIGLMHVVELKKNPATGEDFDEADNVQARMTQNLRDEGVLARAGASIPVAPPLIHQPRRGRRAGQPHFARDRQVGIGPRSVTTRRDTKRRLNAARYSGAAFRRRWFASDRGGLEGVERAGAVVVDRDDFGEAGELEHFLDVILDLTERQLCPRAWLVRLAAISRTRRPAEEM